MKPAKRAARIEDLLAPPGDKLVLHLLDVDENVVAEFRLPKSDFLDERPVVAFRDNRTRPALLTSTAVEAVLFNQKGGIRVTGMSVGTGGGSTLRMSAVVLTAGVNVTLERLLLDLTKVKAYLDGDLRWVVKG